MTKKCPGDQPGQTGCYILNQTSLSVEVLLVTVTLSVRRASVLELEFPLNKATNNKISTAPPTTHTHGSAYHVSFVVVVVVTVLDELDEVSWASATACTRQSMNRAAKFFREAHAGNCFICRNFK